MGLSDPWVDSIENIDLHLVKKLLEMNPIVTSAPRDNSLEIIALQMICFERGY